MSEKRKDSKGRVLRRMAKAKEQTAPTTIVIPISTRNGVVFTLNP